MSLLRLEVVETAVETATIRRIVLRCAEGKSLPGFEPGAHVTVHVPGVGRRKYSLINTIAGQDALTAPKSYLLGVRRDDAGHGGSAWMHRLVAGDTVEIEPPENDFPLAEGAGPVTLIAGGIGVTPLISKAANMKAAGRPFRFIYAARSHGEFAFLAELQALAGGNLVLHADDEAGRLIDIRAEIEHLVADEPVYICGPRPMLKAALQTARALGWADGRLRFELFYSPAAEAPTPPPVAADTFEVEVRSTGAVYTVPPDKTILAVLIEAGLDPLHDCDKGECGVCLVNVLAGVPDHKDTILSEAERAANKTMQICVSRARSARLVLDL